MTNKKPIPKSQVRKTPHGWQVYAAGPKGHIAQGQPHKDLGAAQRDAKKFEDVEIDEADVKKTKAEKKKALFKSRKYRFTTPGQDRDFETLDANRMFKSYEAKEIEVEDAPTTSTAGVANWNPLLGGRKRKVDVYMKKRRSVDGRTKDYKETVTRLQARRDASAARDLEQKLNMFGVQSNPFREDTQMENKKYLKTKEGSIEDAVLQSMRTEAPSNPNDARPTLHLPEKKYLDSKEGSLERAVTDVVVTETISGNMIRDLRTLNSLQFRRKYNQTKAAVQTAGSGIQRYGRKGRDAPVSDERQEEVEDAYDYKAKKGAIAAPGSGSIAKAKKAKSSDVNKSIEQQMADARKEEMDPRQEREMLKRNVNNPAQSPKAKELMRKRISKLSQPKKEEVEMDEFYGDEKGGDARLHVPRLKNKPARQRKDALKQRLKKIGMKHAEEVEMDESWKKVKPTDRVQRLDQLSISGWLSKQMGRKGDPHKFNHKVPSIYFDDVDLVVDSDTVVPRALSGNTTMADLLKKVQAHAKKKRLRWEAVEMGEKHEPGHKPYKLPRQLKNRKTEKMVGTKKGTKVVDRNDPRYKHHPEHESVEHDDRGVGSQAYTDYIRNLTPGETAVKDKESKESSSASKQASAEKKRQVTKIDDAVDPAVKMTTDKYKQEKTKMKQDHILDVAKIKASKVGEEVIVGLLDMGIIKIDESNETGFTVINDPVANRENLLRLAYNTGAQILSEKKVSSDDYDHATALYKDQWKDRKIADYDKEHGKDSRAKEMRKDAEVDRKRMWGLTGDKWKHAKGSSGEVKGKKSEVGNPDPKDAYKKEEVSPLVSASVRAIGKLLEKDWIKGAIKKPGALHRDLGVPEDEKIPKSKIKAAAKEGGKVGQRARLAITLGKMNK